MADRKLIAGKWWYQSRWNRIDVPYSIVLEWCCEQFGAPHRWPIAWHASADAHNWGSDGGNFFFRSIQDKIMFDMRWL